MKKEFNKKKQINFKMITKLYNKIKNINKKLKFLYFIQ